MMYCQISNKMTPVLRSWTSLLLMLPVALAESTKPASTTTVVLLFLLLIVICIALVLAWKKLVHTEGGEAYHPWELWQRAQERVQSVKNRWNHEDEEESFGEDEEDEEEVVDLQGEEPNITAL
ncbi:unnamed protein product [Staurois parvus]|uniref:Small integral membrane protein 24-like n=1 Tax=Staurois parvus TaxID=386267 RepID=A0ABN9D1V7_9NEOB|nr:unnamed protein product [Staurois parvus]